MKRLLDEVPAREDAERILFSLMIVIDAEIVSELIYY